MKTTVSSIGKQLDHAGNAIDKGLDNVVNKTIKETQETGSQCCTIF